MEYTELAQMPRRTVDNIPDLCEQAVLSLREIVRNDADVYGDATNIVSKFEARTTEVSNAVSAFLGQYDMVVEDADAVFTDANIGSQANILVDVLNALNDDVFDWFNAMEKLSVALDYRAPEKTHFAEEALHDVGLVKNQVEIVLAYFE